MLKGQCYDERVDIFSFGIMLCEVKTNLFFKKKKIIENYFLQLDYRSCTS